MFSRFKRTFSHLHLCSLTIISSKATTHLHGNRLHLALPAQGLRCVAWGPPGPQGQKEDRAELLAAACCSRAPTVAAPGRLPPRLLCSADKDALGSLRGQAAQRSPRPVSLLLSRTIVFPTRPSSYPCPFLLLGKGRGCWERRGCAVIPAGRDFLPGSSRQGLRAESGLPCAGVSGGCCSPLSPAGRALLWSRCASCAVGRPACGSPQVDAM